MKKVVLAIVILVIIVTGGVLEDFYIHKTFSSLNEKLVSLENSIKSQSDDCIDKANEIFDWWEKKRMYMELFAFSPDVRSELPKKTPKNPHFQARKSRDFCRFSHRFL